MSELVTRIRTLYRAPFLEAFRQAPSGRFAIILATGLLIMAVAGPIIMEEQANDRNIRRANEGPSADYVMGTDRLGRDIFARTIVATRLSLELAIKAAVAASVVGFTFGATVAFQPSRLRTLSLRLIDIMLAFPFILIAIFIVAITGPGKEGAWIAIGFAISPSTARIASALATTIAGREYIASARVLGLPVRRVVFRYILPNIAEVVITTSFQIINISLVAVSSLSFLGLGVQPPEFDWGAMLTEGVRSIYLTPTAALAPAVAIATTGLAVGFMGEAFSRAMNPLLWTRTVVGGLGQIFPGMMNNPLPKQVRLSAGEMSAHVESTKLEDSVLLRARGVNVQFPTPQGVITPVNDVTFDIHKGEIVGIVGESGSGKTMTALALAQLVPYPGQMSADVLALNGEDLRAENGNRVAHILGTQLAMIFQDPMSSLNPALRIETQLTEAPRKHRGLSGKAAHDLAVSRMGDVHIPAAEARLRQYPHEFSGGMRQRAMIAMGLMNQPSLIIADEPTTSLDVTIQAQIIDVLKEINQEFGTAIILISHDIGLILEICSRVMVMYGGQIVDDIPTTDLLHTVRHPYTEALIAAVPDLAADRAQPLSSIPGRPPDLDALPPGCAFAPRCPQVIERCETESPSLVNATANHRLACWVAHERLTQTTVDHE